MINKKITAKTEFIRKIMGIFFTGKCFRKTPMRKICNRCKINSTAINYCNGNKYPLYRLCLKYYRFADVQKSILKFAANSLTMPEKKFSTYIQASLEGDKQTFFGKLVARESFEPTGTPETMIEK